MDWRLQGRSRKVGYFFRLRVILGIISLIFLVIILIGLLAVLRHSPRDRIASSPLSWPRWDNSEELGLSDLTSTLHAALDLLSVERGDVNLDLTAVPLAQAVFITFPG